MNYLLGASNGGSGGDRTNYGCDDNGGVNSLAAKMMERCFIIEKEDSDPDNAVFAGKFGGFFQSLMRSKED